MAILLIRRIILEIKCIDGDLRILTHRAQLENDYCTITRRPTWRRQSREGLSPTKPIRAMVNRFGTRNTLRARPALP